MSNGAPTLQHVLHNTTQNKLLVHSVPFLLGGGVSLTVSISSVISYSLPGLQAKTPGDRVDHFYLVFLDSLYITQTSEHLGFCFPRGKSAQNAEEGGDSRRQASSGRSSESRSKQKVPSAALPRVGGMFNVYMFCLRTGRSHRY